MKSQLEIVKELDLYIKDPSQRAVHDGTCLYKIEGRMCAFGRCEINPPTRDDLGSVYSRFETNCELQGSLKEEYRGHSNYFWNIVQIFHDKKQYWGKDGLSERGRHVYNEMILFFSEERESYEEIEFIENTLYKLQ